MIEQGQAGGSLRSYCDTADTDYIPLGFINYFPEQGNGWPGSNYASSCWAETYTAPGYRGVDNPAHNRLFNHCPGMAQDIQYCQSKGKKMLLSLGGGPDTYSLTGKEDGESFAEFLWGAYGPITDEWTGPRPFDPLPGTEGEGTATIVDGFDFDIEHPDTGKICVPKSRVRVAKSSRQIRWIYCHDQQASQLLPQEQQLPHHWCASVRRQ